MGKIKKKILITINYWVEDENNDFWDKNTGYLNHRVNESLKELFPKTVKLSEQLCAQRYSLMHQPIESTNTNVIQCPHCNRLLTDKTKSKPIYGLDEATELDGVMMCSSCAWELKFDLNKHQLISGKPPLPKGAYLIQTNQDKLIE